MGIWRWVGDRYQELRTGKYFVPEPEAPTDPELRTLAHIGDSTSWQDGFGPNTVRAALVAKGWRTADLWFYAKISKPLWSGDSTTTQGTAVGTSYTTAQNIDQARAFFGSEPDVWQINLGANNSGSSDSTNELQVDLLLNKLEAGYTGADGVLRRAKKIQFFGISQADTLESTAKANRIRLNRALRTKVERRTLIPTEWFDWNRIIKGYSDAGYWNADGVHMSQAGYAIKNRFFADSAGNPAGGVFTRPSGPGYVRYEDLAAPGDGLREVLAKVTNQDILTLPVGTFEFDNFAQGGAAAGLRIGNDADINRVGGIIGSGRGTILRMVAGSSDKTPPTAAGTTNPYYLVHFWKQDRAVFANLTLEGTEQGHPYGGLRFSYCKSVEWHHVYFKGCWPGYSNFPPGETFGVNCYYSPNHYGHDNEYDGRLNGVRACASPYGSNTTENAYLRREYAHDGFAGMFTWWETTNIFTVDVRHEDMAFQGNPRNGQGLNHEKVGGVIRHIRPKLKINRESGNTGLHISLNNSTGAAGSPSFGDATDVAIYDIEHDLARNTNGTLLNNGALSVQISNTYHVINGASTQTQTTMPTIVRQGKTLTKKETVEGATASVTDNFVVYR